MIDFCQTGRATQIKLQSAPAEPGKFQSVCPTLVSILTNEKYETNIFLERECYEKLPK